MTKQFHIVKNKPNSKLWHKEFSKILWILPILLISINTIYAETWELPEDHYEPHPHNLGTTTNGTYVVNKTIDVLDIIYYGDDGSQMMPPSSKIFIEENESKIIMKNEYARVVMDKQFGSVSIMRGNNDVLVSSDSYVVRASVMNTDNWFNLVVNDEPLTVTTEQPTEYTGIVSVIRENNQGLFKVEYNFTSRQIKSTAYFTNYSLENHKIGFTHTLDTIDDILVDGDEIKSKDIKNKNKEYKYNELKKSDFKLKMGSAYYKSGIGFDQFWSARVVGDGKIAMDYGNIQNTTPINGTAILDPVTVVSCTFGGAACNGNYGDYVTAGGTYPAANVVVFSEISKSDVRAKVSGGQGDSGTNKGYAHMSVYVNGYSSTLVNRVPASCTFDGCPETATLDYTYINNGTTYFDRVATGYSMTWCTNCVPLNRYYDTTITTEYTVNVTAPTNLTVDANTLGELDLAWNANDAEAYKIERSVNDCSSWSTLVADTNNMLKTYTDTGLSNSTSYCYRITTLFFGSPEGPSSAVSNYTLGPPGAPTSLVANAVDSTQIDLDWIAPNQTVTGYKIERESPVGNGFSVIVSDTGNTNVFYNDTGLSISTTYNYRVTTLNSYGNSTTSNEANATTFVPTPTNLTTNTISISQINLNWDAPIGDVNGYKIERESPIGGGWSTIVANTTNTNIVYNDTGLSSATQYNYRVSTHTDGYTSDPSTEAYNWTQPESPISPSATPISNVADKINLEWSAPSGTVNSYLIERAIGAPSGWSVIEANYTGGLYYNDTGLQENTTYFYRIASITNPIGPYSPPFNATTGDAPDAPANVTASLPDPDLDPLNILVSWDAPIDIGDNTVITGYDIIRSVNGSNYTSLVNDTAGLTYNDLSVIANTNYTYAVGAKGDVINGNFSGPSNTITTPDISSVPQNFSVLPRIDHTSFLLDWDTPASDGGSAINGYQIQRNTNDAGWVTVVANTGNTDTEYIDTGLSSLTNYKYIVYAINGIGGSNGSSIEQVEFTNAVLTPVVTQLPGNAIQFDVDVNMTYGIPDSEIYDVELRYWSSGNLVTEVDPEPSVFVAKNNVVNFTLWDNISETTDYYMRVKTTNGLSDEFSIFQTGKLTASPALILNKIDRVIGVEYRNESFNSSNLQIIGKQVGFDLVVVYKEFNNLDNVIVLTWEDVISEVTEVISVDPTKKYYISVYFKPTFDYTIGGSPIAGNATIPIGYPVDLSLISMPDPNQVGFTLGIDVIAGESGIFGLPLVFIFIIALASIFTGRSAPMGIIFIAVALGFMAYMGLVDFNFDPANQSNTATWAIIIVAVIIGVMVGKRWD